MEVLVNAMVTDPTLNKDLGCQLSLVFATVFSSLCQRGACKEILELNILIFC